MLHIIVLAISMLLLTIAASPIQHAQAGPILESGTPTPIAVVTKIPAPTSAITPIQFISPPNITLIPEEEVTPTPTIPYIGVTIIPNQTITPLPPSSMTQLFIYFSFQGVTNDVGGIPVWVTLYKKDGEFWAKRKTTAWYFGDSLYRIEYSDDTKDIYDISLKTDRHLSQMAYGVHIKKGENRLDLPSPFINGDIDGGLYNPEMILSIMKII